MNNNDGKDASFISDLYITPFTGMAGMSLHWNAGYDYALWQSHFPQTATFLAPYNFDESSGNVNGWMPGYDYDEKHYESGDPKPGIVDLFYLRSPDEKRAVGILANRTYNFYTQWDVAKCGAFKWSKAQDSLDFELIGNPNTDTWNDQAYNTAKTAYNINESMQVDVKSKKRYIITYIDPSNLQVVYTQEKYNLTGKLRLDFPYLTGTTTRSILLVCVEPKNNKSFEQISDSTRKYLEEISAEIQDVKYKGTTFSSAMVAPNPTDQDVLIALPVNTENCTVTLFSCSGMMIKAIDFYGQSFLLDVGDCDAGVYILKLSYNQKVETIKLIIQ